MATMSTVPKVLEQVGVVLDKHKRVSHHSVRRARELRAIKAAEAANQDPSQVSVPDLEPQGMPGVPVGLDPLAGL